MQNEDERQIAEGIARGFKEHAERGFSQLADSNRRDVLSLEDFNKKADLIERFFKWIWALCAAVAAAVSMWVISQWTIAHQGEEIKKNIIALETVKTQAEANKLLFLQLANTMDANRRERLAQVEPIIKDVDAIKAEMPKVVEMWFMKKHGISNKEAFAQENPGVSPGGQGR
jgi:hypothetical protein